MNTEMFKEILKKLRKDAALSQEALADALRITPQAVSKWECGQSLPDVELIVPLADFFGVSADALLRGKIDATVKQDAPDYGIPDDGNLRVVQFIGSKMVSKEMLLKGEMKDSDPIPLCIDSDFDGNVEVWGNARIDGDIGGNASVSGDISCGDISGDASASGDISCADVGGSASAMADIRCADVGGNASAMADISCSDVGGDASASGNISCGDIGGDATASGDINCGDINGDVTASGVVSCNGDD